MHRKVKTKVDSLDGKLKLYKIIAALNELNTFFSGNQISKLLSIAIIGMASQLKKNRMQNMVKILRFRFQRNSKRRERWKKQKTMAHCEYFAVSWLALNVWWWWWKGPLILKRVSMKRQFNLESRGLLFISFGQISIHRTIIWRKSTISLSTQWILEIDVQQPYHTQAISRFTSQCCCHLMPTHHKSLKR